MAAKVAVFLAVLAGGALEHAEDTQSVVSCEPLAFAAIHEFAKELTQRSPNQHKPAQCSLFGCATADSLKQQLHSGLKDALGFLTRDEAIRCGSRLQFGLNLVKQSALVFPEDVPVTLLVATKG